MSSNSASEIGRFTLPHQTRSAVVASRTTNLSFGERPVWWPVRHTSGPPEATRASRRRIASS